MVTILSNYGHTNKKLLKKILVIFLVCCVLAEASLVSSNDLTSLNFIMFGSKTCPHCKALHNFFNTNYQGRFYVFWVEDVAGSNLFYKLAATEINYGLSQDYAIAVPQTLVLREGTPIAVVIGEVENTEFWNQLVLSNTTSKVSVYLGSSKSGIVIPSESLENLLSDLEKNINPQTSARNTLPILAGSALILAGVAVLMLYLIKRRT